jgi:hypothetical protein
MKASPVSHTATAVADVSPGVVFATAANLANLPLWWFTDWGPSGTEAARRRVRGTELQARRGVGAEVISPLTTTAVLGRAVTTEPTSLLTFECVEAVPGEMLWLRHWPESGDFLRSKRDTRVSIRPVGAGSEVRLTQDFGVDGFGLAKSAQRWALRRTGPSVEKTALRLIALAEESRE